jgi:hypothetical protein
VDSRPRGHGGRPTRIAASLALALLALSPGPLTSQDTATVRPGSRVRITLPRPPARTQPRQVAGTLVALRPPVIAIANRGDTLSFALDSVLALAVSRGRGSHESRAALVGAALGLVAGVAISQLTHPAADRATPREVVTIALVGGFVGTGLGVVVGQQVKSDRWEPVRVPGR